MVPAVLCLGGKLSVGLGNARLVGAVATVLLAFWKKTLLFTMEAGMVYSEMFSGISRAAGGFISDIAEPINALACGQSA
jgi:hypothetical protein